MKEFVEAMINRLWDALFFFIPGALFLAFSLAIWSGGKKPLLLENLPSWAEPAAPVLGALLSLFLGVLLFAWSTQGCERFYALRYPTPESPIYEHTAARRWPRVVSARLLRLAFRFFHWMPRSNALQQYERFLMEASRALMALSAGRQALGSYSSTQDVPELPARPIGWQSLAELRGQLSDAAPTAGFASRTEAELLHQRAELLLSCSLALVILGLELVVRFVVYEYGMLMSGAGLSELPTLALGVACIAGSRGLRVLAAGWWDAELRFTVDALRIGLPKAMAEAATHHPQ